MAEEDLERSEQATPKRKEEARKKGQVALSRDISSVAVFLGFIGIFIFFGARMVNDLLNTMGYIFKESASMVMNAEGVYYLFLSTSSDLFMVMLPLFIVLPLAGAGSQILQVGLNWSAEPLKWDLARISPKKGFKRIFSSRGVVELIKSILKIGVIGGISYILLMGEIETLISLNDAGFQQIVSLIPQLAIKLIIWLTLFLMVLSLPDFIFQKWKFEQDLKMSKHAVKEEFKQTETNPLIKARFKTLQKTLSRNKGSITIKRSELVDKKRE